MKRTIENKKKSIICKHIADLFNAKDFSRGIKKREKFLQRERKREFLETSSSTDQR